MSQNSLIEKINQDTEQTVAAIVASATAEVETISSDAQLQVAVKRKEYQLSLDKQKAHASLVAVSKAKQSANIAFQTAKREGMDNIFSSVGEKLQALPSDAYVATCVAYGKDGISGKIDADTVLCPVNRESETEKIMDALHLKGTVVPVSSMIGGIVVHTKDGVYDLSLDRRIADKRAEIEIELMNLIED